MSVPSNILSAEVANEFRAPNASRFCPICGTNISSYKHSAGCGLLTSAITAQTATFVQAATPLDSGATSGTVSQVLLPNQSAGNLNVIAFFWNDITSTVTSIQDSANNVYIPLPGQPFRNITNSTVMYYCAGITALTLNAINITLSATATFRIMFALEYSGMPASSILDVSASNTGNSTALSCPITTTNANDLVVAFGSCNSASPLTAGQTLRSAAPIDNASIEDTILSTSGLQTMTFTANTGPWIVVAAAFKTGAFSQSAPGAILVHN